MAGIVMRGFLFACALAGFATLGAFPAGAAGCDDAATQADMNECSGKAYKAADQKLNSDYRRIERRLSDDPDAKKLLVAAQRAWIAFRDAECGFSASAAAGGSLHPAIVARCLTDLTEARIQSFGTYLNCEEGDVGCPVPPAD